MTAPTSHCADHEGGTIAPCRACARARLREFERAFEAEAAELRVEKMTAPSPFCPEHPSGAFVECRECRRARRRHELWVSSRRAEARYAARHPRRYAKRGIFSADYARSLEESGVVVGSAKRGAVRPVDVPAGRVLSREVLLRFNDDQRNSGEDRDAHLQAADQRDDESATSGAVESVIDEVGPEAVVNPRVEVEHGAVVVELHCHGGEPTGESAA